MKTLISAALLAVCAYSAQAAGLVVQLTGPAPVRFAGYALAEARGYYAEEGLEVALRRAEETAPFEALARGRADLAVGTLPVALLAREHGLPLVNFAQPLAQPALRLTCLDEAGVKGAADLRGKTIGSRFDGQELALTAWLNRLGLVDDHSPAGVSVLRQWPDAADMLRQRQVACIVSHSFAAPPGPGTVTLDPAIQGAEVLEDGLYTLQENLDDPEMRERLAGFLRASMRGWREAARDPEGTARLILGPDPDEGVLQRRIEELRGIAALLSNSGRLDEAGYRRSVDSLTAGGPAAVLRDAPRGAFTHAISDMAAAQGQDGDRSAATR
ncbi:ABC transporter substrate-binding protein [Paracoccus halophilus]|nr:ABC transporter substrate-binding protein [Paracoccus halophilus]